MASGRAWRLFRCRTSHLIWVAICKNLGCHIMKTTIEIALQLLYMRYFCTSASSVALTWSVFEKDFVPIADMSPPGMKGMTLS